MTKEKKRRETNKQNFSSLYEYTIVRIVAIIDSSYKCIVFSLHMMKMCKSYFFARYDNSLN